MKIRLFIITILISLLINGQVMADYPTRPQTPQNSINTQIQVKKMDQRAQILASYLAKFNSPLQFHAQDFVEAADANKLDWKLVAAISGVESTFGKFVPGGSGTAYNSYNAWGWGVYGTQAIYFKSWKDGINTVSEGLRQNYFDKGYTDPYSINRIYAASPTWGYKVSLFLNDLQAYQQQYHAADPLQKYTAISFPTHQSSSILALEVN